MRPETRWHALALALIVAMYTASVALYPRLPARVPMHWGIDGQPDGWGGPGSVFLMPTVALGVWALMVFLPRFDPGKANYPSFAGAYALLRTAVIGLLALVHGASLAAALGQPLDMGRVISPALGVLYILVGGLMGKIRPNWFVGVRTPWTLTSKLSWTRTHRATGWLFVGVGVLALVADLFSSKAALVAIVGGALLTAVFSMVYSHHVWARDPDRQSPGGTTPA